MLPPRQLPAVVALLLLHALLAWWAAAGKGLAYDEAFHLTGGFLYNRHGDFRIHPDNGILPQRVHGLAPLLAGAASPDLADAAGRMSDQGVVAHRFLFLANADHRPWLRGARALNLVFSVGACLLAFLWARSLGGDRAGFTALALAALSPTLLAHGALATSDAAAACFLGASTWAFARQLQAGSARATIASVLLFGAACLSKYSAAVLPPVFLVLTVLRIAGGGSGREAALRLAAHGLGAWALIWVAFGLRHGAGAAGLPPVDQFIRSWEWIEARAGWQAPLVHLLREGRILPEAFVFGYAHTYIGSLARPAFLAGQFSETGWVSFFPLAFLWKSTLAELAAATLAAGSVVAALRQPGIRRRLGPWTPLLLLGASYGGLSLASNLNIGHRHLLPLYPLLSVAGGVAAARLPRAGALVAAGLALGQAGAAAAAYPHYLAYFGPVAGGSGWRLLVDSSLDWGQELPALRSWLQANNAGGRERVFLSYFGSDQPEFHGIQATRLPFTTSAKFRQRWYEPGPGLYVVSATMLQQVYGPARGRWSVEAEAWFRRLRAMELEFREAADAGGAIHDDDTYELWERYDQLRFARLCHYLKARRPEAVINQSLFVFRLDDSELDQVLRRDAAAWGAALETAARDASGPGR